MDHFKNTSPEHIKLTVQNICLKEKAAKCETEQMKFEIENKSNDLQDSSLHQ